MVITDSALAFFSVLCIWVRAFTERLQQLSCILIQSLSDYSQSLRGINLQSACIGFHHYFC